MERRGSGIGRILNLYTGFYEQPVFESNEYFFMVSLPNRGVAKPSQMELQFDEDATFEEKTQLSPKKAQLFSLKAQQTVAPDDWELKYFHDVIIKQLEGSFRGKTLEKIEELFSRYRYTYTFNRTNIAELFGITENRASNIIRVCVENGIMVKLKNGVYSFISSN